MKKKALPPHGSYSRYQRHGCTCMACMRGVNRNLPDWDGPPSWQIKHFFGHIPEDVVRQDYGDETVDDWKENGIEDFAADRLATYYGVWPPHVWKGYLEAGLDFYEVD